MGVTSAKSFTDWGEVFIDQVLATAILDRPLRQGTTLNIKRASSQLRDQRTASPLDRRSTPTNEEVNEPAEAQ